MKYDNISKGIFISRPNRFIAEVNIDGKCERVHVKNTGRCKELLIPGCEVYMSHSDKPERKTAYDLVAVVKGNGLLVNIDSQAPNKVALEWLKNQNFTKIVPEYKYGDSRLDFYMEKETNGTVSKYLIEIKGCTLEVDGIGYFPDAPTQRGVKHIRELIKAKKEGYNSILGFVIQMDGIEEVRANVSTHKEFGDVLQEAEAAGVEIVFLTCHIEPNSMIITSDIWVK